MQRINPIGLTPPLDDSKTNSYSKKSKLSSKPWYDCLEKWPGINPVGLSDPLDNSKTKNYSKKPNYHQKFRCLPWSQSITWRRQLHIHNQHPHTIFGKPGGRRKIFMSVFYMAYRKFLITPEDKLQYQWMITQ